MKKGSYYSSWANLAAAIISSGERENDRRFLESDWCDTLKELCKLDDELHSGIKAHFNANASKTHMSKD